MYNELILISVLFSISYTLTKINSLVFKNLERVRFLKILFCFYKFITYICQLYNCRIKIELRAFWRERLIAYHYQLVPGLTKQRYIYSTFCFIYTLRILLMNILPFYNSNKPSFILYQKYYEKKMKINSLKAIDS